jgi:uncharacterized protein YbjT (DUF2867 family)
MILLVGATGDLGGRILRALRDRDRSVRCLVRPQTNPAPVEALGGQTARGDLTDRSSLAIACAGVDTIIASATAIGRKLMGERGPSIPEVDGAGMIALVDAAETAGVRRFVHMSFAGADASLGSPLERAKLATERRLRRSPMHATSVRSDGFQEIHLGPLGRFDMAAGKVAVFGNGDSRRRFVATDDVAALVAAVADEPDAPAVLEFGGPEALSRNEAIAVAERLTGRRMKRQRMPRPVARVGMRLLSRPNPALASVFAAGLLQDLVPARWDDGPLRERGIVPRSATDFLRAQAASLTHTT